MIDLLGNELYTSLFVGVGAGEGAVAWVGADGASTTTKTNEEAASSPFPPSV